MAPMKNTGLYITPSGAITRPGIKERVVKLPVKRAIWPGDTIGISLLSRGPGQPRIMLSWGSAVSGRNSQIWAAQVRHA